MRRQLFSLLFFAESLFAQSGGGMPVNIPIPHPSFELGYGQTLSQDLGISPVQLQEIPSRPGYYIEGVYKLTFSVSNSLATAPYPGYYTMKISFGTQELCESSAWGKMVFTNVPMVCSGPGYIVADKSLPGGGPVQGSKNLVLTATVNDGSSNGGWPLKFENVFFTFTPSS